MDNQWKDEECGTCEFNIDGLCRRSAPCRVTDVADLLYSSGHWSYPQVENDTLACYYWRKKINENS